MLNRLVERLAASFSRTDLTRLLASLILATMLWGWVSLLTDPEVTRTYANLTVVHEPLDSEGGELILVTSLPTITVRLTGPESVIEDVAPSDITVSIDTSEIDEPGSYTLDVQVDAPNGVRKRQATPPQLTVEVERTSTENFDLVLEHNLPQSDPRQVGQLQPSVSVVTVRGPESDVERVDRVVLPIEIGAHSRDFEEGFTPIALDADGNSVPEVTISPERVEVTVPVSRRGRSVAVLASVQGVPAEGYEVVDRRINPATVQVDGPPEVLSSSITVLTEPIDIGGAAQTVTRRVALDQNSLPPGVVVIEPADGIVEVVVQIDVRGVNLNQTLPDQVVMHVGLEPAYDATIEPEAVAVTVVATESQLQALEADDIVITVDLAGLEPGVHELSPIVSVPANMRWVSTDPDRVTVTIRERKAPSATPAGTPEASPLAVPE